MSNPTLISNPSTLSTSGSRRGASLGRQHSHKVSGLRSPWQRLLSPVACISQYSPFNQQCWGLAPGRSTPCPPSDPTEKPGNMVGWLANYLPEMAQLVFPEWLFSVQFSRSVVSDSLRPHEPQHARPPCPSPTPRDHPNPLPSSR